MAGWCRKLLPLPTSNSSDFWIGNSAKFTDKGLCVSTEGSHLFAESPVGMTDKKNQADFLSGMGHFYRCRPQNLSNLSGKNFGRNGSLVREIRRFLG